MKTHVLIVSALATMALAAPAAAEHSGWTGWSEFYRSFALEPPPAASPVKLPGIHKVPDITLKRGVTGTMPKTNVAPKPKSSLDAVPEVPSPVAGWDPKTKKTIIGPDGSTSDHGVGPQQSRDNHAALADLPAPPAAMWRYAGSAPNTPAAIRRPVLDNRKYTDLVDDLVKPGRSAPSANGLAQKPNVHLPGTGSPYSGKYLLETPTHTLRGTGAGDTAKGGDVLPHRWQRNGIGRR